MRSSPKSPSTAASLLAPEPDCSFCPRLVAYRAANRSGNPDWFNAPVPSFGCLDARLLVVGMAPGIRGANRTGRPFTGDHAGILLYQTLIRFGFATGVYRADPSDGVALHDCRIVNAVRCVPPANLPTPAEVKTCNQFLASELRSLPYATRCRRARPTRPRCRSAHAFHTAEPLQVRAWHAPHPAKRAPARRQLPCVPLQHEHGAADDRDVRGRHRGGEGTFVAEQRPPRHARQMTSAQRC